MMGHRRQGKAMWNMQKKKNFPKIKLDPSKEKQ
jgi:hypothetical protein